MINASTTPPQYCNYRLLQQPPICQNPPEMIHKQQATAGLLVNVYLLRLDKVFIHRRDTLTIRASISASFVDAHGPSAITNNLPRVKVGLEITSGLRR